jgi:hypothetical protein
MRYIVKTYLSKTNILIEGFSVLSSIFIEPSIPISCGQICLVYIHASTTSLKGCTIPRRSEPFVGTGGVCGLCSITFSNESSLNIHMVARIYY